MYREDPYYAALYANCPMFNHLTAPNLSTVTPYLPPGLWNDYRVFGEPAPPCCITYDKIAYQDPSLALDFTKGLLVTNVPPLAVPGVWLDPSLLEPWGLVITDDIIWVANTGTGLLTSYNLNGEPIDPVVSVGGRGGRIMEPTGLAYNYVFDVFVIHNGPLRGSSGLIVVTRDGTIHGYNVNVNPDFAVRLVDNSQSDAVYTGACVANVSGDLDPVVNNRSFIYATDFYNQRIDTYDGLLVRQDFFFTDEDTTDPIPDDYGPYNIVHYNRQLYVLWAKQRIDDNQYEEPGSGQGFISIFQYNGQFVRRYASRGCLNAPWGLIEAPATFGYPVGSLLIGNYGDSSVNVFNHEGIRLGSIKDRAQNSLCFGAVRGLAMNPLYRKQVYWTTSRNHLRDAFVGVLTAQSC